VSGNAAHQALHIATLVTFLAAAALGFLKVASRLLESDDLPAPRPGPSLRLVLALLAGAGAGLGLDLILDHLGRR
jgi:hypothetical protein